MPIKGNQNLQGNLKNSTTPSNSTYGFKRLSHMGKCLEIVIMLADSAFDFSICSKVIVIISFIIVIKSGMCKQKQFKFKK